MNNKEEKKIEETHIPVLLDEVVDQFRYLQNIKDANFVDGTLGLAGHSISIANFTKIRNDRLTMVGIDKDLHALEIARERIKANSLNNYFILNHNDFNEIEEVLAKNNISQIDGALLDLGVSSLQLDEKERGFSFSEPEQFLDMRMNQQQDLSAIEVLNNYPEQRLEWIIKEYGEERFAKVISQNIVKFRHNKKIEKVEDLLKILSFSIPVPFQKKSKIHFATKTFQAIRIEVNSELSHLEDTVSKFVKFLKPGGKLAIITFHSLEDRIIKNAFRNLENPCKCPAKLPCVCGKKATVKVLTRKPTVATEKEIKLNPRSRSAKLRVLEKIVNE